MCLESAMVYSKRVEGNSKLWIINKKMILDIQIFKTKLFFQMCMLKMDPYQTTFFYNFILFSGQTCVMP